MTANSSWGMSAQASSDRTPTVGYGTGGTWQGLDVDALVRAVAEGFCPACELPLATETLRTYNHRNDQNWGCCHCCSRAWRLEEDGNVKATACIEHTNWDCPHPLPGGTWTPAGHSAAWPGVRKLAAGASVADFPAALNKGVASAK